ncbi:MAG: serine protease [Pirellulaceae bacterium]|nr:MAG: serine protease [Pirellulaceae bacterium]
MKRMSWTTSLRYSAAMVVVLATGWALGDDPAITRFDPPGLQRGTEAEWVISGARLDDATELLFYDPGVEVLEIKAENANRLRVKVRVAEDCVPGLHAVRLATRTGISNLRYFGVTALPQIEEQEPNSDFEQPQKIALNSTINGVVTTEDVDYYAVELSAGQKLTVELEGLRLGTEFFDPFVAILDDQRFELASSDDAPLLQQDCVCSYVAEKAGTYYIEVRESAFGGNDRCQYRLHVGDFPRPLMIVPSGGRPGETIQATLVDASGETWQESIQLPETPGEFDYLAVRDGKVAPSPNRLRVVDMTNVVHSEPDDDRQSLPVHDTPVAFNGVLEEPGDVDWFKIRARKDQTLVCNVYGRRVLRSPVDSWLEIHKATGGRLAANDDSGGPDSQQSFKFPEDGEYLIAIRDQLFEGSPIHGYRIEVAPPQRSLTLTIDELQRYISQTVEVPQGAQMAVLLRAQRANFGGDLALRLEGMPAGLELLTPTIAANQSYIPLMIRAAADAPPDAALVPLIAETLPDGPGVRGELNQRTMLVRGQNNRDMWGHDANRLAVAVTEKLPFQIELVQPQVPVVRDGSTHYVVRVVRDEGYNERIYLRALYNPSGLSASGSVRIEPGQNEAQIPVTANSRAALGTFPVTVLARAKSRNANVWVASNFINLEVVDSFFGFQFNKSVVQTGQSGVIPVGLEVKRPPEGKVTFEIVGLPAGVTCDNSKIEWSEGMEQLSFPISVAADARTGQFKTLYVRATISRPGGDIVQTTGTGELQLVPPPPQPQASPPAEEKKPAPAAPAAKPLSRLEQLRKAKGLLQDD